MKTMITLDDVLGLACGKGSKFVVSSTAGTAVHKLFKFVFQ